MLRPFNSGSISGRVVCEDSSAILAGLPVRIYGWTSNSLRNLQAPVTVDRHTTTDHNGAYQLSRLPPGDYIVQLLRDPDQHWTHHNFLRKTLSEGESMVMNFPLLRGQVLQGQIVDSSGNPVHGAQLNIEGPDNNFRKASDEMGRFSLRVPSGDYRVAVLTAPESYVPRGPWSEMPRYGPDVLVTVPDDKAPVFVRFRFYRGTTPKQ